MGWYVDVYQDASMGPQLDSCGRASTQSTGVGTVSMLQWGRNLTVAEGEGQAWRKARMSGFNGAAT